jgi:hypothetical protein
MMKMKFSKTQSTYVLELNCVCVCVYVCVCVCVCVFLMVIHSWIINKANMKIYFWD